jgi:hypothetical protein
VEDPICPNHARRVVLKGQGFTTLHMAFLDSINGYNPLDEPALGAGLDRNLPLPQHAHHLVRRFNKGPHIGL